MEDFRGKLVRVTKVSDELVGELTDDDDVEFAKTCLGKTGTAKSIYLDGSECHKNGYIVELDAEHHFHFLAEELELVDPSS